MPEKDVGTLFVHVRLTMPWLFTDFEDYGFVARGDCLSGCYLSESLRRRKL
jgi:hypothetical protein